MADVDCERADLLIGLLGHPGDTGDPGDGALTPAERAEAEAHVASCASCREALAAYHALSGALHELPVESPSAAGKARAYAAVVEAMAAGAAAPTPSIRVLEGGATRARQGEAAPAARRRPAVWLQGIAAAACVLIVATLAYGPSRADRAKGSVASSPTQNATQDATSAEEQGRAARTPSAPPATTARENAHETEREPVADLGVAGAPSGGAVTTPQAGDAAPPKEERDDASTRDGEERAVGEDENEKTRSDEAAGEALGGADDREEREARRLGDGAAGGTPPSVPPSQPQRASGPADEPTADEPVEGVIAAWRVGDQLLVLEHAGEAIVARELSLALLEQSRAEEEAGLSRAGPGAGQPTAPPAPAEAATAPADADVVQVESLPPTLFARLRGDTAGRRGALANTGRGVVSLDANLRTILAAELNQQPRDAAWTRRVTALLSALGDPAAGATPDRLAARARRHLATADAAESAPASDR